MQGSPAPSGAPPIGVPAPSPYERLHCREKRRRAPRKLKAVQNQQRTKVGLSLKEESRARAAVRRTVPSEPWVDIHFRELAGEDAKGEPVVYRFQNPHPDFPPGGVNTGMVKCRRCGVYFPPDAQGRCVCLDHLPIRVHSAYGTSPSAHAIRTIRERKLKIEGVKLEPEGPSALRREIRQHQARASAEVPKSGNGASAA